MKNIVYIYWGDNSPIAQLQHYYICSRFAVDRLIYLMALDVGVLRQDGNSFRLSQSRIIAAPTSL